MLQTVVVNLWYACFWRVSGLRALWSMLIVAHDFTTYNPKIKVFMTQDNDCYDIYDSMMVWSNKH